MTAPAAVPPTGIRLWVAGARPKTLGAAISPVLVGTAAGSLDGPVNWWRALAALIVALALQVGVNFANDYSDGVRGTDTNRRGPIRLVASGLVPPAAVRNAAIGAFGVAAVVGGVLSLVVNPWLLVVGVLALVAAATYTGGPKPYGYIGLGEVMVLVFFGFVATVGSAYVQHETVPAVTWLAATAVGLLACAILVTNNLRDIEGDRVSGKRTLATRLGVDRTRKLYAATVVGAFLAVIGCIALEPTAALAFIAVPLTFSPVSLVSSQSDPPSLVKALVGTARLQLVVSVLLAIGLGIG
jgi:1,4-dihydroxy-2-naphthoate octaprenyltransferase